MSHKTEYIWTCKIGGPAIQFQSGADAPMRQAVQAAFKQVTGNDEVFCFSGWGGELTEIERAIVENRLPSDERAAVQAAQPEAVGEPWGVDANKLLSNAMKPSEIAGPADVQRRRVSELLSWFARLADGQANPKWTTEHAFELAYYIASAPTPEPMSAPTAEADGEPTEADWADFGAWAERDKGAMGMLEKLIDVWDDGQLPHEHRCYVDGAWSELIAEARSLLAATPTEAKPAQQDAVDAIDWAEDARMWGNALNSAGWEFDSAYRRHIGENAPDKLFNFCKPIIRDVILKYAERVAAISAKKGQP